MVRREWVMRSKAHARFAAFIAMVVLTPLGLTGCEADVWKVVVEGKGRDVFISLIADGEVRVTLEHFNLRDNAGIWWSVLPVTWGAQIRAKQSSSDRGTIGCKIYDRIHPDNLVKARTMSGPGAYVSCVWGDPYAVHQA